MSHREAIEALRVAELSPQSGVVTEFADVAVAALCTVDSDRTYEFVRAELGDLAAGDEATTRIRDTLREFLAMNCNHRATAVRLHVHHNTVRYRIAQAERLLERSVDERRFQTELALHLTEYAAPPAPRPTQLR